MDEQNLASISIKTNKNFSLVKEVSLKHNNIQYRDILNLVDLPNLEILYVTQNKITGTFDLGILVSSKSLILFHADHNQVSELQNTRKGQENPIKFLSFTKTDLIYVDMDIFKGFKNLKTLWLDDNHIFRVDSQKSIIHLPKIKKISIENNPLICSNLKDLVEVAEGHGNVSLRWTFVTSTCNGTGVKSYGNVCCFESFEGLKTVFPELFDRKELKIAYEMDQLTMKIDQIANSSLSPKRIYTRYRNASDLMTRMTTLEDKQFVIYVINLIAFVIVVILSVIIVIIILRNRVKSPPKEDIKLEEIELKDKNHEQEEIYAEIDEDE